MMQKEFCMTDIFIICSGLDRRVTDGIAERLRAERTYNISFVGDGAFSLPRREDVKRRGHSDVAVGLVLWTPNSVRSDAIAADIDDAVRAELPLIFVVSPDADVRQIPARFREHVLFPLSQALSAVESVVAVLGAPAEQQLKQHKQGQAPELPLFAASGHRGPSDVQPVERPSRENSARMMYRRDTHGNISDEGREFRESLEVAAMGPAFSIAATSAAVTSPVVAAPASATTPSNAPLPLDIMAMLSVDLLEEPRRLGPAFYPRPELAKGSERSFFDWLFRRPRVDDVDCSVFAPIAAPPGATVLIQVFLHIKEHAFQAHLQAVAMDPGTGLSGVQTLQSEIRRGARVSVSLSGAEGLQISEPQQTVVWQGQPVFCQFLATLADAAESYTLRPVVRIAIDGAPIGRIIFTLRADDSAARPETVRQGDSAKRYTHAFLSYAHEDRKEVLKRAQLLEAIRSFTYFQDVVTLRAGDHWETEIAKHIDRCDLFLLFWSRAALASDAVRLEAEHALARHNNGGGVPDIVPIILETPPPLPPPPSLAAIHFNDRIHHLIAGS